MSHLFNNKVYRQWFVCALLGVGITACSSDSTVSETPVQPQEPMQFSQSALSAATTRAVPASSPLTQGFLVSCFKGTARAEVMDRYQVQYKADLWNNSSKWEYVGTTAAGFYKDQLQRYWDHEAFPYQFYAVSPCPANDAIPGFTLSGSQLVMPATAEYAYQTCQNGIVTGGSEPYYLSEVTYQQAASYVALPFKHLTSIVKFVIYNNYKKEIPTEFKLYNVKIKGANADFAKAGRSYTADLSAGSILQGTFADIDKATGDEQILVQTDDDEQRKCDLKVAVDRDHAYDCLNPDGLLQLPQKGVKLTFSFDVYGVDFPSDFSSEDGHVKYDMATKTIHYTDVELGTYDWEPSTRYTYVIKVNEFYPLTIDMSAELTPWVDVVGNIDTNLEK